MIQAALTCRQRSKSPGQRRGAGAIRPSRLVNSKFVAIDHRMFVESRVGDAREKSSSQGVPQRATIPAGLTHISIPVADQYVACRRKRPHTSLLMKT